MFCQLDFGGLLICYTWVSIELITVEIISVAIFPGSAHISGRLTGLLLNTWTPRMPNTMKNMQHMRTMLPIGRNECSNVWTTSLSPGARLITLFIRRHHQQQEAVLSQGDRAMLK